MTSGLLARATEVVVGWPILQKVTFIDCWFCLLEVALLDMFVVSYVNYVVYCERYLVDRPPLLKTSRKKKVTEGRVTFNSVFRR